MQPPHTAAFFSDVLTEVLVLNPDERSQVEDTPTVVSEVPAVASAATLAILGESLSSRNPDSVPSAAPAADPVPALDALLPRVGRNVIAAVVARLPQRP